MEQESAAYVAGQMPSGDAWAAEAAAAGRTGTQRIVHAGWLAADREVAAALLIAIEERVVVRRRLVLLDDRPVEIAETFYPYALAAETRLAEPAKIKGGAAALLAELGYRAAGVRETVSARLPTSAEQVALDIAEHQPVLVLKRISSTSDGSPFEFAVMTMNAAERELHYHSRSA